MLISRHQADGLRNGKTSYDTSQRAIEGESGKVQMQTTEASMERLPEICKGTSSRTYGTWTSPAAFFVHYQTNVFQKKKDVAKEANIRSFV